MNFNAIEIVLANRDLLSVCAIGIARVRSGKLIDTKAIWVRPEPPELDPSCLSRHDIPMHAILEAPAFRDAWGSIFVHFTESTVIAHRAVNDYKLLHQLYQRYGGTASPIALACSMELSKRCWPGLRGYELDVIATHIGVPLTLRSLEQRVRAVALIALRACCDHGVSSLEDLLARKRLRAYHIAPPTGNAARMINLRTVTDAVAMRRVSGGSGLVLAPWRPARRAREQITLTGFVRDHPARGATAPSDDTGTSTEGLGYSPSWMRCTGLRSLFCPAG